MLANIRNVVTVCSEPMNETVIHNNTKKEVATRDPIVDSLINQGKNKIVPGRSKLEPEPWFNFKAPLIWTNIVAITILHVTAIYTIVAYNVFQYPVLIVWGVLVANICGFGVTGGAHRLWTHRAYKAKLPLRIILIACFLTSGQNSMFNWVRDHRVHHKFTETDADPHNTNRGFFFSHVGWLMMKKHPEVLRRGRQIDMTDVTSDPVIQFTEKHFVILKIMACFVLPVIIPVYCWNQDCCVTILSQIVLRYVVTLNNTWSVNSFAHLMGTHSYDKSIRPAENPIVSFMTMGEGWHNYHHTFPWDYKTAELGNFRFNATTTLINMFAKIGWAYDLKEASDPLIQSVIDNRGDGSQSTWGSKSSK